MSNNLVFTASVSQAEIEAKLCRAQQWGRETNCAEGDSEHTWEECSELLVLSWRSALGNPAEAGVFVGNPQEKLLHPHGCCKTGPVVDRVVWCSSGKALKWLLLRLAASFRKDYCLQFLHQGCL